jgi:hypothetical protein
MFYGFNGKHDQCSYNLLIFHFGNTFKSIIKIKWMKWKFQILNVWMFE